jgi:hypothetical protein
MHLVKLVLNIYGLASPSWPTEEHMLAMCGQQVQQAGIPHLGYHLIKLQGHSLFCLYLRRGGDTTHLEPQELAKSTVHHFT